MSKGSIVSEVNFKSEQAKEINPLSGKHMNFAA
jgi:hypothetical protein